MNEKTVGSEILEPLRDALADILDITLDWCQPLSDAEKLALIHKVAEKAWQEAA